MLDYTRVDLSEGIHVAKSNNSNWCTIFHYWYFKDSFKFLNSVCNGCHDLLMLSLDISDIDYRCDISNIIKSNAIHLLETFLPDDFGFI